MPDAIIPDKPTPGLANKFTQPHYTLPVTQDLVNRITEEAQNSHLGLGKSEKRNPHDLRRYTRPTLESIALLYVDAYQDKYDITSVFAAALQVVSRESSAMGWAEAMDKNVNAAAKKLDTLYENLRQWHDYLSPLIPVDEGATLTPEDVAECIRKLQADLMTARDQVSADYVTIQRLRKALAAAPCGPDVAAIYKCIHSPSKAGQDWGGYCPVHEPLKDPVNYTAMEAIRAGGSDASVHADKLAIIHRAQLIRDMLKNGGAGPNFTQLEKCDALLAELLTLADKP